MPARPMWRSPHRKMNPWSKGYVPDKGKHPASGQNDKGNVPEGKKKKADRVKQQPIGMPQGKHADGGVIERMGLKDCFCGGCYTKNNGAEELTYG